MKPRFQNLLVSFSTVVGFSNASLYAADLHKFNNADALTAATSWVENVVPGTTDNLIWDSTRTAAGSYSFGNGQFTGGVTIQNPGGLVQLRVASNGTTTLANNALIDMSAATVDAEWTGGAIRIENGNYLPTFTVAAGRTLTIGGNGFNNRGNTKTFTFAGAGDVIVNANVGSGGAMNFNVNGAKVTMNNAASGWTYGTVTSGKLVIGNSTVLSGKRITNSVANGLAFGTGVTNAALGGLEGSGSFVLGNSDTSAVALTIGSNNTSYSISGAISGAGSLIKTGTGTQTLSGDNGFTGGIFLNAGAIAFGHSNAAAGGKVTASNGTTVNLANSASVFLNGTVAVSGAGSNVVLSSSNISAGFSSAFTGAADQTLTISGANQVNIGSNFQQFSGMDGTVAVASGATLRFSGSSLNNGGSNTTFDLTGNLVTRNNGVLALGALSGNGNISMGGAGSNNSQLSLSIGAKGLATTFGGAISDADALNGKIVNVTKTGAGTQTFSGISTYTGATLVSAGTLLITGELSDTAVTVDGGTFGGTGTIASSLAIVSGSLQVADLANSLSVGGTVTLFSGFGVDNLAGLVWGNVTNDTYTLIDGTLADGIFAQLNHNSFATAYDIGDGRKAYFQEGSLQLVVIPEPGAALLGSLGLLALMRRRRA